MRRVPEDGNKLAIENKDILRVACDPRNSSGSVIKIIIDMLGFDHERPHRSPSLHVQVCQAWVFRGNLLVIRTARFIGQQRLHAGTCQRGLAALSNDSWLITGITR